MDSEGNYLNKICKDTEKKKDLLVS